jgi:hypothetical protein
MWGKIPKILIIFSGQAGACRITIKMVDSSGASRQSLEISGAIGQAISIFLGRKLSFGYDLFDALAWSRNGG